MFRLIMVKLEVLMLSPLKSKYAFQSINSKSMSQKFTCNYYLLELSELAAKQLCHESCSVLINYANATKRC